MESDFHGVAHSGHRAHLTRMASSAFGMDNGEDEFGSISEDSDLDEEEREKFRRSEIRHLFNEVDVDHSGFIDKREVNILLGKLGLKVDSKQIDEGFNKIDKDHSGKIEYEEFYDWFSSILP